MLKSFLVTILTGCTFLYLFGPFAAIVAVLILSYICYKGIEG